MKKSNAGFTLVEVVIAISIAVLVSIASAAVIISTRSSSKTATLKNDAVAQASAVMECFKSSGNMDDFVTALEFTYLDKDDEGNIAGSLVLNGGLDFSSNQGGVFYLYLNENCTLYRVTGETSAVQTVWNNLKTKECKYVVAVNVAKSKDDANNSFKASTMLNIAVYNVVSQYTTEPIIDNASTDGNVLYHVEYVKGVAG